jgi:hypothetical protein
MPIDPSAPIYPEKDTLLLRGNNEIINPDDSNYFGIINDQAQPEVDIALLPGVPGQRGPQGPPGADGVQPDEFPALVSYRHVQNSPSTIWTISHNLAFYPNLTCFDSGGSMVEGEITSAGPNTLIVQFSSEISGTAHLS